MLYRRHFGIQTLLAGVFVLAIAGCSDGSDSNPAGPPKSTPQPEQATPPANPFFPEGVVSPLPNPASVNTDDIDGPTGPTRDLSEDEIQYAEVGPGHYLGNISGPYADGRRVIWTKGTDRISKLDYETLEVLADFPLPGRKFWTADEFFTAYDEILNAPPGQQGVNLLLLGSQTQTLEGAYPVLDRDNVLYVGYNREVVAYKDAKDGMPESDIAVARTWPLPEEILGNTIGISLTYDGRLVTATTEGFVIVLERDFSSYYYTQLPFAEEAAGSPNDWIRNSLSVDDDGGIYAVSNSYLHKVIWKPEITEISIDPEEGAWSEPYRNGLGTGSGSTPVLIGFGDNDDQLVAITDGDELMNLTVYWRNEIPEGWEPPPGAASPRVAGYLPANFGDPNVMATQNEQQVLASGYTMMIGQNDPANIPQGLPTVARVLAIGFLGQLPEITPYGIQGLRWNPATRALEFAWGNLDVSPGSCIPRASAKSNLAYWIGIREGVWALQGINPENGELVFFQKFPAGVKYNNLFSGVLFDNEGNVIYGTSFGFARLLKE